MSGVGKGVTTASIGKVLQANGYKVNLVKVDPYLNVDAGTMNPIEHGEAFVLRSGLETDQDMGNYERFLGRDLPEENYVTSGMVYRDVIERERNLGYDGKCVEAIPHIRDEIINRFEKAAAINGSQISVIEVGGTVGDFQNAMFIEASRVMKAKYPEDVLYIMVTYLPVPPKIGEMKTKPTQNAIRQLNSYGVQPDFIIGRSEEVLDSRRKDKIAQQCNIKPNHVISAPDIESIYDVPLNFERDNLSGLILEQLHLRKKHKKVAMTLWEDFVKKVHNPKKEINIAIVGKYFSSGDFVLSDVYISVIEAIKFSSFSLGAKPKLTWISSQDFESGKLPLSTLKKYDGVIVPGGFGTTGIDGIIRAIQYARENKIPYLGLCYGMQLAVIEYARNVVGIKDATTREMDPDAENLVIDIMEDQKKKLEERNYGGTMRLGVYPAEITKGTLAHKAYGEDMVEERHRHRYEVNPQYIERLEEKGMVFSGTSPDGTLMEIAELPAKVHPFFVATQFHPELQAKPLTPHPLFTAFAKSAIKRSMHSSK